MAASCWHWWHAPVYFAAAVILAVIAVSTAIRFYPSTTSSTTLKHRIPQDLITNASKTLRRSGFHITAALLHISPDLFLSTPSSSSSSSSSTDLPNATIFAIQDSSIFNASSLPPWLLKQILQYHMLPSKYSFQDLLKMPENSCFPTLLNGKDLQITEADPYSRMVKINNVPISNPNLFLGGPISIHGVLAPFSALDPQEIQSGWATIQSPPFCNSSRREMDESIDATVSSSSSVTSKSGVNWRKIVRLLSSKGYVALASGLNSVLGEILEDYRNLRNVTIFAPPELGFMAEPVPVLGRIVRMHIVPERLSFTDLALMLKEKRGALRTLAGGGDMGLEITEMPQHLGINGVEITLPDCITSESFTVHGISRDVALAL